MRTSAIRPIGDAPAIVPSSHTRVDIKAILKHNEALGAQVQWCLGLDWQRTRYKFEGYRRFDRLFHAAFCWEWWAVVQYRFAYWVHKRAVPDFVRRRFLRRLVLLQQAALLRFCYMTGKLVEGLSGARFAPGAEVGPGLLLIHTGSTGIGSGAVIGCNFTIYQDVSIMPGHEHGFATIGDNVTLYTGARVIGPVRIGDHARVGANAVVTHDLPPNCLAIGAPARPMQRGEHPSYSPSAQVNDLLTSLILTGDLEEVAPGSYREVSSGEMIKIQYEEPDQR